MAVSAAIYGCLPGESSVRLSNGADLRLLVRLFSGSTVLEFIAGPPPRLLRLNCQTWRFAACWHWLAMGCWACCASRRRSASVRWLLDCLAMVVSFFLVAGPTAIAPHVERYGVCLIAPGGDSDLARLGLVAASRARLRGPRRWRFACWPGVRWAPSGGGISVDRADRRRIASGVSHRGGRAQASRLGLHRSRASGGRAIRVIADSWWLYWPLAYLSAGNPQAQVLHWDENSEAAPEIPASPAAVWLVEFCEPELEAAVHDSRADAERAALRRPGRTIVITDYSGRPLLSVTEGQAESAGSAAE